MEHYSTPDTVRSAAARAGGSAEAGKSGPVIALIWKRPMYFFIWLITALAVGWLYIGLLTNPEVYDAMGWVFALAFPVLTGATLAVLVANYREQKACPLDATGSGLGGSIVGIFTVGCSTCPAILLGWIGLGAAVPSAFLASPWLKLASLLLLVAALFWAGKKKSPAS
ncbi:MAG: hypothetical protein HY323_01690 [Betaproteobacteria bacterium]|nr:hypothetical protein [Betaproteobacteria bacterium]